MKLMRIFPCGWMVMAALALAGFLPGAFAANTNDAADTNTVHALSQTNGVAAGTNSGPVDLEVPVSTFDVTIQPTKDPFFPLSLRQPVPAAAATNAAPAFSATAFVLKALAGQTGSRLAMINNRTLAVGESTSLTLPSGKVNIRVLQIKESSVVIRVDSQPDPIEIFLRKAAQ
jgi:hypothetical protein